MKPWTSRELEIVRQMRHQGQGIKAIAKRLGRTYGQVNSFIGRRKDIPPTKPFRHTFSPEKNRMAHTLYRKGLSIRDMADRLRVSETWVRAWMRKKGFKPHNKNTCTWRHRQSLASKCVWDDIRDQHSVPLASLGILCRVSKLGAQVVRLLHERGPLSTPEIFAALGRRYDPKRPGLRLSCLLRQMNKEGILLWSRPSYTKIWSLSPTVYRS